MTGQTGTALRRLRLAAMATALLLGSTACGLQRTGVDGAVTAGVPGSASSAVGGQTPLATPGGAAGAATSGAAGVLGGSSGVAGGPRPPGAMGSSGGGSGTNVSGSGSGARSAGSSGGGAARGGGSTSATTAVTPGLHGDLVVSYINVTGFDQLGKVVVVKTASTGDASQQANALASYVNAHGGIAGRKLVPKVHGYNAQQASEVNDNNLCQSVTESDKAFMVVLHGQIHYSARDCYAAKKTLAFEGAAYGFGKAFYDAHHPYLWSPSYADYDAAERALVASIKERGWLNNQAKVGVVLWDDKPYHDIADNTLVPLLKGMGKTVVQASVSDSDIGSIEDGIHTASTTMIANQVDHLLFIGSAPLQPFFVQQNQQNKFVYALTSFDVPRYMAVNFPSNMAGSIGIGFSPVDDVLDPQYHFPQPGLETQCLAIYKSYGVDVPARYSADFNSKQAMSYCESTLLLKKVADSLSGELTGAAWTAAAERLASGFQVAQTFVTSYSADKHTGATDYRDITYDGGCSCMTYTSGNRQLQ